MDSSSTSGVTSGVKSESSAEVDFKLSVSDISKMDKAMQPGRALKWVADIGKKTVSSGSSVESEFNENGKRVHPDDAAAAAADAEESGYDLVQKISNRFCVNVGER